MDSGAESGTDGGGSGWSDLTGWERLAPGVARRRLPHLDVTVGVVVGDEGVLVVDTGSTLGDGASIRREVRELTGRTVTHVVLTHGHFDHCFGTAALSDPDGPAVDVYGEKSLGGYLERERLALRDDAIEHGTDEVAAAEAADMLALPNKPVDGSYELDLGGDRQVRLTHPGRGHTGHDLVVTVPGTVLGAPAVVFCGDLIEESGDPQVGPEAAPAEWPGTLDRLLRLGGETAVYVPGHGTVVDARFVRTQRDILAARFGVV